MRDEEAKNCSFKKIEENRTHGSSESLHLFCFFKTMRTLEMLLLLSILAFLPRTTEAACLRFPFFPSDLGCRGDTPICVDSSGKRARFRGSKCVRCVNARNLVFRNRDQGCLSRSSPDCVLEDGVSEPAEDKEGAKCVNMDDVNVEEGCCDQDLEPGFKDNFDCDGEGYACCPDGSWACSIGDGQTFVCGGNEVVNPQGKVLPPDLPKGCEVVPGWKHDQP